MASLRLLRLVWHVLMGSITVALLFPRLDAWEQGRRVTRWSTQMLRLMGVKLIVKGRAPHVRGQGALIVANHISWLDIHLLHGVLPCRFVSKAEVAHWPLIGWLARQTGTLFLVRERRSAVREMNAQMATLLAQGECLTVFPEGTTTAGGQVLPFRAALFEPVVTAEAGMWPVSIRYWDGHGQRSEVAAYYGEMSLAASLWRIAKATQLTAEVHFLPPVTTPKGAVSKDRRALAGVAEQAIRADLEKPSSVCNNAVTMRG
ncbi:MAG: 1-acyl-sn-glycerol-3-phosphate acyltransferase [Betaproteobacteria bacterium]|nr:MAG: 1-acyl-sn-glycerol-3-phosphate acyltransferase [Betaproteobacteria bacterium]